MLPWLHPTLVHFAIGLLVAGLLFDVVGLFRSSEKLVFVGFANTVAGACACLLAVATGLLAQSRLGAHSSIGNALLSFHNLIGVIVACVAVGLAVWRILMGGAIRARTLYLAAALFTAALVSITGGLGGMLVYWYGMGISPETARRILEAQPASPPGVKAPDAAADAPGRDATAGAGAAPAEARKP